MRSVLKQKRSRLSRLSAVVAAGVVSASLARPLAALGQDLYVDTTNLGAGTYAGPIYNVPAAGATFDNLIDADTGTGIVNHSAGTLTLSGQLYVGLNQGSNGTYTLSGTGNLSTGSATVGVNGTGYFSQTGGTFTDNNGLVLGLDYQSTGTYSLGGMDSLLKVFSTVVGAGGTGFFNQAGGTVYSTTFYVGFNNGSSGVYTLQGSGILNTLNAAVGDSGNGTVTQNGGAFNVMPEDGSGNTGNLYLGFTIAGNGSYTLNGATGAMTASNVYVGYMGTGTVTQNAGSFNTPGVDTTGNTGNVYLGYNTGAKGTYALGGGGVNTVNTYVGYNGSGTITQTGGTVNVIAVDQNASNGPSGITGNLYIGYNAGSTGNYTLNGSASVLNTFNTYIGYSGTATLTQNGGSFNVSGEMVPRNPFFTSYPVGNLYIGYNAGANGSYTINGSSSEICFGAYIGYNGSGSVAQTGGTFSTDSTLYAGTTVTLGANQGSTGTYTLSGGGSVLNANGGTIEIGHAGTGVFTQTGGTVTTTLAGALELGVAATGNGTYTLSGSGSSVTIPAMIVGYSGTGTFIQSGGSVVNGAGIVLGNNAGSSGTYRLGGTASLSSQTDLTVGFGGMGIFEQSSGSVAVNNIEIGGDQSLGVGGGSGSYQLSSGTVTAQSTVAIGVDGPGIFSQTGGSLNAGVIGLGSTATGFGKYKFVAGNVTVNQVVAGSGIFTQSGGLLTTQNIYLGATGDAQGTYNLVGGTISFLSGTQHVLAGIGNLAIFNFNGGVIENDNYLFLENLTANVRNGGAIFGGNGTETTLVSPLVHSNLVTLGQSGQLAASGSGYTSSPTVTVTGGGGYGATAVAILDNTGHVINVVITDPGADYTSAPNLVFSGGGGSGASAAALVTPDNAIDGGLTMNGSGTLFIGVANTYTGGTTISAGTMNVGGTDVYGDILSGSITGGNIVVSAGATLAIASTGSVLPGRAATLTADGTGPNPAQVTLAGGGSLSTGEADIGYLDTGLFNQSGGSFTTNGQQLVLGYKSSGHGSYTMGGGNLSTGSIYVGYQGTGVFLQNGGSVNTNDNALYLGNAGGSAIFTLNGGTLTVGSVLGGTGSTRFNFNGGTLQAGGTSATFFNGVSPAYVQAGGAIIDSDGFNVTIEQSLAHDPILGGTPDGGLTKIGLGTLAVASVNTYTGPTTVNAGTLSVVNSGSIVGGSVAVEAGATLAISGSGGVRPGVGATLTVDGTNTSPAMVTLAGAASLSTGEAFIGPTGTGIFTQTGGTFTTNGSAVAMGVLAGSSGTYSLNGGTLNTDAVVGGGGFSRFNLNGGTLQAGGSSSTFVSGLTLAAVQTGGAILDSNGFNVTLGQSLVHDAALGGTVDGGLTKLNGGILALLGANTYTGGTTINGGMLQANNLFGSATGTGAVVVNSGGSLAGDGTVAGAVTINSGGDIFAITGANSAPSLLTLDSLLTFEPGAALTAALDGTSPGNGNGAGYSELLVSGPVTLGGDLDVLLTPGFTPSVGRNIHN